MRTIQIAIVGPSPCDRCDAACCRQSAWAYAVLLQTDEERRRFAPWSETVALDDADGVRRRVQVIAYREGRCPFLGSGDRCTIYQDRPLACRAFECTRAIGRDDPFLTANPRVAQLLANL